MEESKGSRFRIGCQLSIVEVIENITLSTGKEAVFDKIETVLSAGFCFYQQIKAVESADFLRYTMSAEFIFYFD